MPTNIRIQIDDDDVKRALHVAPNAVINAMHTSLKRSAVQTQRYFRETLTQHHNVFTGNLRNSVNFHFTNKLSVVIEPEAKYADNVEYGSRPHFVPIRAIAPWARFHGLDPFVVQQSIARKGTRKHPFLKKTSQQAEKFAIDDMQKQLDKTIKEVL